MSNEFLYDDCMNFNYACESADSLAICLYLEWLRVQ